MIIQALAGIWKSNDSLFHDDDDADDHHRHHHHNHNHDAADMEVLSLSRPSSKVELGEESKDNHQQHNHHHRHGHDSSKKKKKKKKPHRRNKVAPEGVVRSLRPVTSPSSKVNNSRVVPLISTTVGKSKKSSTTKVHTAQPQSTHLI